jgi:tetratricopeptide (TPR) repeat protein
MFGWIGRRLKSWWFWVAVATVAVAAPQGYAWWQLRTAKAALAADRPADARTHLAHCSAVWPWGHRTDVLILRSRAERQAGELDAAMEALRAARRGEGETTAELVYEWALLQAAGGNVAEVADYLQQQADDDPSRQRDVWEALVQGYLAVFRANDAYTICQQWVEKRPDDLRAKELRGYAAIQGRGRGLQLGADDLAEVLQKDPTRTRTRAVRAVALLDLGEFDEAIAELERLAREQPDQPDHKVRLARCLNMVGRTAEAADLLDAVLRDHPDHGPALRTRGQFALTGTNPAEAEGWLAKAAEVLPNDYQTQFLYSQALLQAGKTADADEQQKRANEVRERATQLTELRTRRLAERPLDPALYTEMGRLLLASGNATQGVRWLEAAVGLERNYRPAHEALADHYEKTGRPDLAAEHRRLGTGK